MAISLLLCDHHSVFTESLALVLGEAGYEIVGATRTPDEAIAALGGAEVDVCLLDLGPTPASVLIRLPELRAAAPGTQMLLLSEYSDCDVVVAATALGIRGFVYKNQHVADIIDAIERVHRGETVDAHAPGPAEAGSAPSQRETHRLARHLTLREREVLCGLVHGHDTHGMAMTMGVSWSTARSHIQRVLTKLGVHSRVEAAAAAVRHGVVHAETGEWLLN